MKIVASIAALAFVAGLSFGCEEKKTTITAPGTTETAPAAVACAKCGKTPCACEKAPEVPAVPAVSAVEAKVEVK